ncbi:zinc finger protein 37-like [Synchiropus splendidus]|uniref:zinc finger protein 37-like n=1 Tax=Synchiropus splendidus TaxID=270530 RepID=UPI00237E9230|nr:zinc finger protein 37-like [Synchiropus splendidus]
MEVHGSCSSVSHTPLPLSSIRLMVPPLQLVSAAVWQTVQKRMLADYGMLEGFVDVVTSVLPELLTSSERAQLTLGLRARLILELCKHKGIVDHSLLQPHLGRIHSLAEAFQADSCHGAMPGSTFSEFIQQLLNNPSEGKNLFQKVYPGEFFSQCDDALDKLMVIFLTRLEKFLPSFTFQQVAAMCSDVSSVLEDSIVSVSRREDLRTLLLHQRDMWQITVTALPTKLPNDANGDVPLKRDDSTIATKITESHPESLETCPSLPQPDREKNGTDQVKAAASVLKVNSQKRKKTQVLESSRPVRSNRGLRMGQYLMEEKREIDDDDGDINPSTKSHSNGSVSSGFKKADQGVQKTTATHMSSDINTSTASCPDDLVGRDLNGARQSSRKALVTLNSECDSWSYYSDQDSCGRSSGSWSYYSGDKVTQKDPETDTPQSNKDKKPSAAKAKPSPKVTRQTRCFICKVQVQTSLKTHMKTHFPTGEYTCPFCDTKFKLLRSLELHLRRTCNEHTQQQAESVPGESLFQCDLCQRGFKDKHALTKHERTHHKLYCSVCRRVLKNTAQLERHKSSHLPFHCTRCEKTFTVFKHLISHCRFLHKLCAPFQCLRCPKSFSKLQILIKHEWKHTGHLPFQCAQCGSKFACDNELECHQRVHTKEKPHLCAVCGKAFSMRSNLLRHLHFIHSESRNERKHSCSLCDKSFKEKGALVMHQRQKHYKELFRFPCPVCGKMFSSSSISRHKLIHTGEKPFKCPVPECEKLYRSNPEVKRHMLMSHSTDRPYKCEVCGKGFILLCHLNSHSKIHSGVKPFVCHICGKAFLKLYSVERHKRLVHPSGGC